MAETVIAVVNYPESDYHGKALYFRKEGDNWVAPNEGLTIPVHLAEKCLTFQKYPEPQPEIDLKFLWKKKTGDKFILNDREKLPRVAHQYIGDTIRLGEFCQANGMWLVEVDGCFSADGFYLTEKELESGCHKVLVEPYTKPPQETAPKGNMDWFWNAPKNTQVGGSHYRDMKLQPIDFIMQNNLDFCTGNAIKYLCRHKTKNGKQDLEKAIHYIQMLMEQEYPNADASK